MPKRVNKKRITDTESEKLKKERSVDEAKTKIVNTIIDKSRKV